MANRHQRAEASRTEGHTGAREGEGPGLWYTERELDQRRRDDAQRPGDGEGSALERENLVTAGAAAQEAAGHARIAPGMSVVGSDGGAVGTVKEVGVAQFLLDRRLARDVYVPFEACYTVEADRVMLNVPSGDIDQQGWPHPDLV